MNPATAPEQRTIDVDVGSLDTRGRTVVGYAAVYGALSEPLAELGGARERIAPGAFASVVGDDVRCLLNHDPSALLGRTRSGTLRLHDEQRGLRFELDLPDSPLGQNVRAAVERGDLDGASFRFVVGEESWADEVRTIERVAALHDVCLATFAAYPSTSVELRTRQPDDTEGRNVSDNETTQEPEQRGSTPNGGLRLADADSGERRTLLGEFRHAGWQPRQPAEIPWPAFERAAESRALTWTGAVGDLDPLRREAGGLGADRRYAWPAFPRVAVDPGVTSVQVLTQTARALPAPASVVRAIDAVTNKPEAGSTIAVVTLALSQVAAVQSGVPNIFLEGSQVETIIGTDLRLALNEGLDKLVLDATAASGFQAPGTDPLLVSVRKALTTILAAGYNPDTLILRPADAEALDLLRTSGPELDWVFGAGRFAPGQLFGLDVRVAKTAAAPIVVDASAFGKLYASPVRLAAFEENAGKTNSALVRLEGHAAFGVERQAAAIRIAAA